MNLDSPMVGAGRSTKAGAETPATRACGGGGVLSGRSLNEGRGRNPSDTSVPGRPGGTAQRRSTKAGAETPATPAGAAAAMAAEIQALNEGRGRNPSDTCYPA